MKEKTYYQLVGKSAILNAQIHLQAKKIATLIPNWQEDFSSLNKNLDLIKQNLVNLQSEDNKQKNFSSKIHTKLHELDAQHKILSKIQDNIDSIKKTTNTIEQNNAKIVEIIQNDTTTEQNANYNIDKIIEESKDTEQENKSLNQTLDNILSDADKILLVIHDIEYSLKQLNLPNAINSIANQVHSLNNRIVNFNHTIAKCPNLMNKNPELLPLKRALTALQNFKFHALQSQTQANPDAANTADNTNAATDTNLDKELEQKPKNNL